MTETLRLLQALSELLPDEDLKAWLQTPNKGFGGKKPMNLIINGKIDLLWDMVRQTQHGAFA